MGWKKNNNEMKGKEGGTDGQELNERTRIA